ncbi:hypothetical protein Uis1B_1168 [Bifidobacterium margollesii]|uniref:Uncharacterized protein n=1 Tax=Bifidobacterium margollesii TaxID=2020964 RepID=A0A2N5J9I8_9BIFI|nr:hypothetical protein Uis1B_1168 [Bifidobacterium margollesii]
MTGRAYGVSAKVLRDAICPTLHGVETIGDA